MSMWISTKDILPADDRLVLWAGRDGLYKIGTLHEIQEKSYSSKYVKITCWSPLEPVIDNDAPKYPNVDYSGKIIKE